MAVEASLYTSSTHMGITQLLLWLIGLSFFVILFLFQADILNLAHLW